MMRLFLNTVLVTLSVALFACGGEVAGRIPGDPFSGCYAVQEAGPPEIRVGKKDDQYVAAAVADWETASVVKEPDRALIEALLGDQAQYYRDGIQSEDVAVLRVDDGIEFSEGGPVTSGYVLIAWVGIVEGFPVPCESG